MQTSECKSSKKVESGKCCSCCEHVHTPSAWQKWSPAISFVLLVSGMFLSYLQVECMTGSFFVFLWYLAAFLPVGLPVMREAWEAIRAQELFNEFLLMVLASVGAFCIGEYPEAVAVMLFYTVGERLQHGAVHRAAKNISDLLDVCPRHAFVYREGLLTEVLPDEVKVGEQIEVKPGERVPLDGLLLGESACFDTSALTGESVPRMVEKGDEVLAGMIVYGRPVLIKVTRAFEQSELARILALVKDASERKAPAELFIRKLAKVYTPVVILLALLVVVCPAVFSLFVPSFHYVLADWLYRGLVFLVISCPCALVISIPLGYFGGIGAASRAGILFKGGNYLDAITRVNKVAFDKTGTLTEGCFEVMDVQCAACRKDELLNLMLSVEQKSTHPIAQAVVRYATMQNALVRPLSSMKETPGLGIEATVDGRNVVVGNLRMLAECKVEFPEGLKQSISTVVACAVDGNYAGALFLSDKLKEDAVRALKQLRALGMKDIHLLSGDKQEIVNELADKLKIAHAQGELLPEDKVKYMEQMVKEPGASVAFVGDGMNDAPVLALSDVGIAMGNLGSDAAIESADVVIRTDQLSKVPVAIMIGRFTQKVVRQNIIGALGVKILILLAGALGYASLWGAVFADVGVALLAVLNALRILYKRF